MWARSGNHKSLMTCVQCNPQKYFWKYGSSYSSQQELFQTVSHIGKINIDHLHDKDRLEWNISPFFSHTEYHEMLAKCCEVATDLVSSYGNQVSVLSCDFCVNSCADQHLQSSLLCHVLRCYFDDWKVMMVLNDKSNFHWKSGLQISSPAISFLWVLRARNATMGPRRTCSWTSTALPSTSWDGVDG